jgi:hypothetical protein
MHIERTTFRSAYRVAAMGFLAASMAAASQAQTSSTPVELKSPLMASSTVPADIFAASTPTYSSSSISSDEMAALDSARLSFGSDANQPPPRRTYSRPTYSDSHTNADGSNKYTFVAGGGFALPISTTSNDLTTSYGFQVGGGRNFSKKLALLLQFDYEKFGFQTSTLNTLIAIYNNPNDPGTGGAGLSSLGGSSHVWSFTLDPVLTLSQGKTWGAYLVGGVGFYHKVADFTTPGTGTECDIYYGCFQYTANEVIDSYVSNAAGFNGGGGLTYKLSRWGNERFFVEGRYVFVANSPRAYVGTTTANGNGSNFDAFPQNGNRTTYIPVMFGLRF